MKLLYFIQALYNSGGMERVLSEKMNYLYSKYGYKIVVVTVEQMGRPLFFPLNEKIELIHLDINFDAHYNFNLFKKYYFHKKKLKQYKTKAQEIINNYKPDICISLAGKEIEFFRELKTDANKVAEIHFPIKMRELSMANHNYWKLLGKFRTTQLKHQTKSLDKLIVLTQTDEQILSSTHKNVTIIPNPIVIQTKNTEYNYQSKIAVSVGRLSYEKGYDILLSTWKIIDDKFPQWQLHIYGEGVERAHLNKIIIENNLQKSVFLKGFSDDIAQVYVDSSFLVLSSRYEGFPLVIIEAMACGLPTVAFDCEFGPASIISDGENGLLSPPENIDILAEKIIQMIENQQLRMKMSTAAKETSKKYELNSIIKQWNNLFLSLKKSEN